jgi:protein TonB
MKRLLTVTILLFASLLYSQSKFDINNLIDRGGLMYAPNDDEPYTGKVFDFHDNGQKKLDGNYRKGLMTGKWTYYHQNGQKESEGTYENGKKDSKWTYWNENGQKREEETYKGGELIVPYTFSNKDGSVIRPINIEELVEDENLILIEIEHRTGYLYENQLSSQLCSVFYTKDTIEPYSGPVFGLNEHGQKKAEGTLKYGRKDGKWTYWMAKNKTEDQNLAQMKVIQKIMNFYSDFTGEVTEDAEWAIQVVNAVRDSVVADSLFSDHPRIINLDNREIEVTVPKSFIWMNPDRRLGENPLAQHVRYITTYDTSFGHLGARKDTIVDKIFSVVVEDRSEDPDNSATWFKDTSFIRADKLALFKASLDTFNSYYVGIADTSMYEHVELVHYYDRYRPDKSILNFPENSKNKERIYKDSEKFRKWTEWYENGRLITNIFITNYGRISVNDEVIPKAHIDRVMWTKRKSHPDLVVSLKADKNASMELINEVLTELREVDALIVKFSSFPTSSEDMDRGFILVVLPPMGEAWEIPKKNIANLLVDANGNVILNNEMIQIRDVKKEVVRIIRENDKLVILVYSHPRTKYKSYIDVLYQLKLAKAKRVNLCPDPILVRPPPARPSIPVASDREDLADDVTIEDTDFEDFIEWDAPPPPPSSGPNVKFIAYDDPPIPIGGYGAIQRNIVYPEIAQEAGIEGKVIIQAFIDEKGRVQSMSVLQGIPNTGLNEAAMAAIKKTRFKPAQWRDRPVGVYISIPVNFKLKG